MASWEMSPFESFYEGEGDFDSVVKDDGVSDVDDDFDGEPEEEQQAPSIVSEVFTVEVIEIPAPAPVSAPLPERAKAVKPRLARPSRSQNRRRSRRQRRQSPERKPLRPRLQRSR